MFSETRPTTKYHPGAGLRFVKISAGTSSPSKRSEQALLRWSERGFPSQEVVVQVIETHASEAVIRCGLQLTEKTKVYLMGEKFTRMGTVRSCQKNGSNFVLTICVGGGKVTSSTASIFDPGVLAVEDFLTEEQEEQILAGLNAEA